MDSVKPQRIGFLIGGISIALIVVMMYLLTSNDAVHPMTPHDVKAKIPAAAFTAAAAAATAGASSAPGAPAAPASAASVGAP